MPPQASALGGSDWRVSSTCEGGACVGVIRQGDLVLIGNTTDPESHVGRFTKDEWRQFLAGVKLGDFDDVLDDF